MKVQCEKCKANYSIDSSKIPDKGLSIKCKKCDNIFAIKIETKVPETSEEKLTSACPKCGFDNGMNARECSQCYVIFDNYKNRLEDDGLESENQVTKVSEIKPSSKKAESEPKVSNDKVVDHERINRVVEKEDNGSNRQTYITNLLLSIILIVNLVIGVNSYYEIMRNKHKAERLSALTELSKKQEALILGIYDNYRSAAYGNYEIDRISEQQLIATEHSLEALQILGAQNATIIELLAR